MSNLKKADPTGWLPTAVINIVTLLLTPWGLAVTTALAAVLTVWKWSREVLHSPEAAVFGGLWLLFFWTWIGLRTLRAHAAPREVITVWDCAYCLAVEGFVNVYDKHSPDACFQLVVNFRNLGNGPIRVKPEEFRLQVNDRSAPEEMPGEIIVSRLSSKGVPSGAMKREALPDRGKATFSVVIAYGRHDGDLTRRFRLKGEVNFKILPDDTMSASNSIVSEAEEQI